MLLLPLGLVFGWGEIPQRGVDPLVDIRVIQEAPDLLVCVVIVEVFRQVHLLFLDRADETLGVAVLPGRALVGHADSNPSIVQALGVSRGRVLDPLIGMGHRRSARRRTGWVA